MRKAKEKHNNEQGCDKANEAAYRFFPGRLTEKKPDDSRTWSEFTWAYIYVLHISRLLPSSQPCKALSPSQYMVLDMSRWHKAAVDISAAKCLRFAWPNDFFANVGLLTDASAVPRK